MPNITEAQAQALRNTREIYSERDRKRRKAAIFSEIKASLKIPSSQKIKIEIDDRNSAYYCALKDGNTGNLLQPLALPFSGPRVIEPLNAPTSKPVYAAKEAWPFPGTIAAGTPAKATPVKPNPGLDRVAPADHRFGSPAQAVDAASVVLKLGSISVDDALKLLRIEGDTSDSFASSSGEATAAVFVKNDRLFFVL